MRKTSYFLMYCVIYAILAKRILVALFRLSIGSESEIMPTISLSSRCSVGQEQVSCDLAGEAVILNLKSGQYFGLNEVGARIWELLNQHYSPSAIRDALLDEYDVTPDQCEQDLLELLQQLMEQGLIHVETN